MGCFNLNMGCNDIMGPSEKYKQMANDSTYINNLNSGLIVPNPNKMQAGLSLNTGQMYNGNNNPEMSTPNMSYADGTKAQSNFSNIKNTI